jgi:outer membrane lipoprotein-sorting protein
VDMTFVSDGKSQERTTLLLKKPFSTRWKTSPQLGTLVSNHLTCMGALSLIFEGGTLVTEETDPDLDQVVPKEIKLRKMEKVGDKNAQVLEYAMEYKGKGPAPAIACKIWFDPETNLPLKRTLEIRVKGDVFIRGVETFSRWEINPEVKESQFTLPKKSKPN